LVYLKAAENLSLFTDQLQGVSNLPEGGIRITAIHFDLLPMLSHL